MQFVKYLLSLSILITLASFGCSSTSSPVNINESPISGISNSNVGALGILGIYEVTVNAENLTVELTPKRFNSIGESWLVSGMGFFSVAPCADCLKLSGIEFVSDGLALKYNITHPFPLGNPADPPTAFNRKDLNVFDLAAVIHPQGTAMPQTWGIALEQAYMDFIQNADGYNQDLFEVVTDFANLPYVIINDETEMDPVPSPTTWNLFEMGSSAVFDIVLNLAPGDTVQFDMYLTMGYGASARKLDRLLPKYFNPEFNRKSAWKVVVTPPEGEDPPAYGNTWDDVDDTTEYTVKVEVYDWQTDAVESSETDFEFADPSHVYAPSEVDLVRIEIEGMTSDYVSVTDDDGTGTGMPGSPLVFNVPIRNENLLIAGEYPGLVCVEDSRDIGDPLMGFRDFLIHTDDGITLVNYAIPAFWTYQTFTATVVPGS